MEKSLSIQIINQIFTSINEKNLDLLDQHFDIKNFVSHSKDRTDVIEVNVMGYDKWKSMLKKERMGFPDLEYLIEETLFDSPKLIVRGKKRGTNNGNIGFFQATKVSIEMNFISIFEFKESKIVSQFLVEDELNSWLKMGIVKLQVKAEENLEIETNMVKTIIKKIFFLNKVKEKILKKKKKIWKH